VLQYRKCGEQFLPQEGQTTQNIGHKQTTHNVMYLFHIYFYSKQKKKSDL